MLLRTIILVPAALVFLVFGTATMLLAYYQDHPAVFLALFFSSSLVILLSIACLVGVIWRAVVPLPPPNDEKQNPPSENSD